MLKKLSAAALTLCTIGSFAAVTPVAHAAPSVQITHASSTDDLEPYVPPGRPQAIQVMPRSIFGKDDRVRVLKTTDYPYSAVVSIGDANSYWCSGAMVGYDVLLTAAHCVVDEKTGNYIPNMIFRPGANGTSEPFGNATAKKIIIGPEFKKIYSEYDPYNPHDDWAVVKLSRPIGKNTGHFGVKANMPSGTRLTLTGYPFDKINDYALSMWYASGEVTQSGEFYHSQIDMFGMQSGSPLYDSSKYIGAINIAESSSENWHERVTPEITTAVNAMKNNTSVLVSSVQVTGTTSLYSGNQTVLTANVAPRIAENKTVTWKSSNPSIAEVTAQGRVIGVKPGKVTITATANDGSKKSGSITITITKKTTQTNIYRLYNPQNGKHLFTSSADERAALTRSNWKYEGIAWTVPGYSNTPVYRLYNPQNGEHLLTANTNEKNTLSTKGWTYEGVAFFSDSTRKIPVYRLYNAQSGTHLWTKDTNEINILTKNGWKKEGVAFYATK